MKASRSLALLVAGLLAVGDLSGFALAARACPRSDGVANAGSCCCGPHACAMADADAGVPPGPGMTSACCSVQRPAGDRDTAPATAREVHETVAPLAPSADHTPPGPSLVPTPTSPDPPPPHASPPRYDLFCTYLI